MPHYRVYQQRPPVPVKYAKPEDMPRDENNKPYQEYEACLVACGVTVAADGSQAIEQARKFPQFARASRRTLGAFPVVEEYDPHPKREKVA